MIDELIRSIRYQKRDTNVDKGSIVGLVCGTKFAPKIVLKINVWPVKMP